MHATCVPEECFKHVDCLSIGEGERTVTDIVHHYENITELEKIEGVAIKKSDGSFHVGRAGFTENIDEIPYPYYEFSGDMWMLDSHSPSARRLSLEDYKTYSRHGGDGYCLITSRSCPNNCSYCINSFYNKLYKDRGRTRFFRRRSVKNTVDEIKHALSTIPTVRFVNFMDDHFLVNEEWLDEFEEEYGREIGLPFIIRGTPEAITRERMESLKNVGLKTVQIGVQSGCAKTHKEIFHRAYHPDKIIEAAHILYDTGIEGMYDFIIGNEFESPDEKEMTIQLMMELPKPFIANVFHIIPFPKTDIVKWYEENHVQPRLDPYETNYKDLEVDYYTKLATLVPYYNNEEIVRLLKIIDKEDGHMAIDAKYEELKKSGKVIL